LNNHETNKKTTDLKIKLFFISLLLICNFACEKKHNNPVTKPKMTLNEHPEIKRTLASLKSQMIDYIEFGEPGYTEKDVETCIHLLDSFLSDIAASENKETGMKIVKDLILKLNDLNEACEGSLIETDQREQICSIIILAGHHKGYNEKDEDITEEWREW
jgi:hypothetical protein